MAHTYVNKSQTAQGSPTSADPASHDHTPGSAATVAILSLVYAGTTARTGGAPTIDGTTATQAGSNRVGLEQITEVWFVCKAFSGSLFNVSIQNDNTRALNIEVVTGYAGSGYASAYYSENGNAWADDTADAGSLSFAQLAQGDFKYVRLGNGEAAPASIATTWTSAVSVYANDHGAFSSVSHYLICGVSNVNPSWTWSNDDGCAQGVCFRSLVDFTHQGTTYDTQSAVSTRIIEKVFSSTLTGEQTYDADTYFQPGETLNFIHQGAIAATCTFVSERTAEHLIQGTIADTQTFASERSTEHVLQGTLEQALTQSHRVMGNIALAPSTNITDGDPTTFQLIPPATKATTDFVAGKISDETNPVSVTITSDNYTELEWSISVNAEQDEVFDLRVTDAGTPISEAITPSITIGQLDFTCQGAITATQTLASDRNIEKVYDGAIAATETWDTARMTEHLWNAGLFSTQTFGSTVLRDKVYVGNIVATETWVSDRTAERLVQGALAQQEYWDHTHTVEHLIEGTLRAEQTWNSYCEFDLGFLNFLHTGTLSATQTWDSQRIREAIILGAIASEMTFQSDKMFERFVTGALVSEQTWLHEKMKEALIQAALAQEATWRGDRTIERIIEGTLGDVETWLHERIRESVISSTLTAEEAWVSLRGIYKIIDGSLTATQTWNSPNIYEGVGTLFGTLNMERTWGHTVTSTRTKLIHIGNIAGARTWVHTASAEHLIQGGLTAEQFFEQYRPFRYSWTKDGDVDTVWINRDAPSSAWTKRDVTSDGWNKRGPQT